MDEKCCKYCGARVYNNECKLKDLHFCSDEHMDLYLKYDCRRITCQ